MQGERIADEVIWEFSDGEYHRVYGYREGSCGEEGCGVCRAAYGFEREVGKD
jgi:hypothetical protein